MRVTGIRLSPSITTFPVLVGSSTDCSVTLPVELVASAVEVQTPESAVYCAVGAAGAGFTGQDPAVFSPPTNAARLALPTTRLEGSNNAPPDAPAPVLPIPLTSPQKVDS